MTSITCPHCSRVGTLKASVPIGTKVRCPGCHVKFEVLAEPDGDEDTAEWIDPGDPPIQPDDPSPKPSASAGGATPAPSAGPSSPPPQPVAASTPAPPVHAIDSAPPQTAMDQPWMTMLAWAFFMMAGVSMVASVVFRFRPDLAEANRFKTDNASGAATNALEHLAAWQGTTSPTGWVIAGLLCLVIIKLDQLRRSVDRAGTALTS